MHDGNCEGDSCMMHGMFNIMKVNSQVMQIKQTGRSNKSMNGIRTMYGMGILFHY